MVHPFRVFFLLVVLCLTQTAGAQTARPLMPDEAVRLALEHDRTIASARADAAAARAAYVRVRDSRLPRLESAASYTRLSSNIPEISFEMPEFPGLDTNSFTLAPVELDRYHAQISLEQPIFTGLTLHRRMQAAQHTAEAARLDAGQQEVEVAYQVREAYWRLVRAASALEVAEKALEQVEAHLADVRNLRASGAALESDVLTASTRRSEVLLDRLDAANAVRLARLELNRVTGLPLETEVSVAHEITPEPLSEPVEVMVERALHARPGLQAAAETIRGLQAGVLATRGAWMPAINLSGRYVYARPNQYFFMEQDQFKGTWEAGLTMNWTIWNWGQRQAETGEAHARLRSAEARYQQALEAVAVDVNRQYLEVARTLEALRTVEEIVAEAEETFRVFRSRYAEGAATSAEVLEAEFVLRRAQGRRADARAEYALARAGLLRATGQVW